MGREAAATSLLGCPTATVTARGPNDPFGSLDSVGVLADRAVRASGWAIDPDDPTTPLEVRVQALQTQPAGSALLGIPVDACTGLGEASAPVEHRAGGDRATVAHLTPGTHPPLVLTRVRLEDGELLEWARGAATGSPARRDLRIELVDEAGRRSRAWTVHEGFPVKIIGPDLHAAGNEVVVETLELSHEGLSLDGDP